MRIFVTGGTGFVGARLLPALRGQGHGVVLLRREGEGGLPLPEGIDVVEGDPMRRGPWWDPLEGCDGAVNLAGAPVFQRWDARAKVLIRESRLATTRNLVACLPRGRPFTLVNASGVGIYGDAGDEELDESAPPGEDFLAGVARDWEEEALRGEKRGARVALTRFGILLGRNGGALAEMAKATRRFVGGPLGSGRQWVSWMHLEDAVQGLLFLLETENAAGPYNFCAPEPARQIDVARALSRVLRRPSLVPAPAFALRLLFGECAGVILASQRARPARLLEAGFSFRFPALEPALRELLTASPGEGTE
ncbi:MAG: TIGR01777 family oxidoreductase [Deferrisomatales bacterium]|nr:TIGR01777 family oxidoreductase [Deferrisomatales bacterium]